MGNHHILPCLVLLFKRAEQWYNILCSVGSHVLVVRKAPLGQKGVRYDHAKSDRNNFSVHLAGFRHRMLSNRRRSRIALKIFGWGPVVRKQIRRAERRRFLVPSGT